MNYRNIVYCFFLILLSHGELLARRIELVENVPLEKQLIYPNCTYVLTSTYLLTKDLMLPENCVFIFEGGNIAGSFKLFGNNTYIQSAPYHIFENVVMMGTWLNDKCYSEWFGAKGDGMTDDRLALQKALDCPIPVLELLAKSYLVASYTDVKNKIGLKVPARKSITGHAVDGWSKDYTINAKEDMAFDVLIQLIGIHISIRGISLIGSRSRNYSSFRVNDLIATSQDNFYTGINLNFVFVSGCRNNGINLYTYNSRLTNCYVTNCDVAYYIHGGKGRGTSTCLSMCTAERARANAYKICQMSYCLLEVCAADHCALGSINQTHKIGDKYGYNYYYEDCRGISEISCGHEAGGYSHYFYECRGVSISTGRYTNAGLSSYEDWNKRMYSLMWFFKSSHDFIISQTTLASEVRNDDDVLLTIDDNVSKYSISNCNFVNKKNSFSSITKKNLNQSKEGVIVY